MSVCLMASDTVPVQKVEWLVSEWQPNSDNSSEKYEGANSIQVHASKIYRFVCHVNGSFPEPQVIVQLFLMHLGGSVVQWLGRRTCDRKMIKDRGFDSWSVHCRVA